MSVPELAIQIGVRVVGEGTIMRQGDRIHVNLRLTDAMTGALLLQRSYGREVAGFDSLHDEMDEWVTRVITVRSGNAAWLVPILRPLIPQAGHLAAMATTDGQESSNKLFMVASYAKVKHITELVRLLTE